MSNALGIFLANVVNNDDVERRGRVVLQVPELLGSSASNWAEPIVPSPYRPRIGDLVYVQFVNGDLSKPVYSATKMLTADMISALEIVIGSNSSPISIDRGMWETPIRDLGDGLSNLGDLLNDTTVSINEEILELWGTFPQYRHVDDAIIGATVRTHDGDLYGDKGIRLSPDGFVAWNSDSLVTFSIDSETGNVDTVGSFRTFHPDLPGGDQRGIVINHDGLAGYSSTGTKTFEIDTQTGAVLLVGGTTRTTNSRVILDNDGLRAYNTSAVPLNTFSLSAATGNVTITGGTLRTTDASNRGVIMDANGIRGYGATGFQSFGINAATGAVTITGGTTQTTTTANRGVVLDSAGLRGYDSSGSATFSISASTGAVVLTGGTTQTSGLANRGVILNSTGLYGFDDNGTQRFSINASTGDVLITGGILRTSNAWNTGVVMSSYGLYGYKPGGALSFSIDAATGNVVISGGTLRTSTASGTGVVMSPNGFYGYKSGGGLSFSIDAATGNVSMEGALTSGSTITGATITGGTLQTVSTAFRGVRVTSARGIEVHTNASTANAGSAGFRGVHLHSTGLRAYGSSGERLIDVNTSTDDARISVGSGDNQITMERATGLFENGGVLRFGDSTSSPLGKIDVRSIPIRTDLSGTEWVTANFMRLSAEGATTLEAASPSGSAYGNTELMLHYSRGTLTVNDQVIWTGRSGGGFFIEDVPAETGSMLNALVSSNGRIYKASSVRESKLVIEPIEVERAKRLLDVPLVSWFDRRNTELYAETLTSEPDNFVEVQPITRIPGVIAEDVEAAGLSEFALYDEDGALRSVKYDRIGVAWIPLVKELYAKIDEIEAQLDALS